MDAITLGVYLSLMQRVPRDNWWTQERGGYANRENAYSLSVSVGYRFGEATLAVHDLGQYSQFLAFTRDDANYDADSETGCAGECLPTTWGYNHQAAQLVSLSEVYRRGHAMLVYGAGLKRTTWQHVRHESQDGGDTKQFSWSFTQTHYSLAPLLGVGYRFGPWTVTGQWIGEAYRIRERDFICCAPSRDVYQIGMASSW